MGSEGSVEQSRGPMDKKEAGTDRLSNSPALTIAMPNAFMRSLGLAPLIPAVPLNPSNRCIRTRMYGGVGGEES
jgi:hypothetical protein